MLEFHVFNSSFSHHFIHVNGEPRKTFEVKGLSLYMIQLKNRLPDDSKLKLRSKIKTR